jgi:uncharacterized RDD family membrane protein YckC
MAAQTLTVARPAIEEPAEGGPGPGQATAGEYAGFVSRLVAYVVDLAILGAVAAIVLIVTSFLEGFVPRTGTVARITSLLLAASAIAVNIGIYFGYEVGFVVLAGQTPGKRLMGVRVVSTDGGPVRPGMAFRRVIGLWLAWILLLGYLMVLIDDRRQGLQDKLANTFVVYAPVDDAGVRPIAAVGGSLRRWARHDNAGPSG